MLLFFCQECVSFSKKAITYSRPWREQTTFHTCVTSNLNSFTSTILLQWSIHVRHQYFQQSPFMIDLLISRLSLQHILTFLWRILWPGTKSYKCTNLPIIGTWQLQWILLKILVNLVLIYKIRISYSLYVLIGSFYNFKKQKITDQLISIPEQMFQKLWTWLQAWILETSVLFIP